MDLDIQCEELSESKWKELVPSLTQYKTIRLDDCRLLSPHCEDLASVLSSSQTLTELKLNNNELGDAGLEKLCKGLMNPSCKLQKLCLQNCNLTKACCENLRTLLSTKPSLTELRLGDNRLGTSGIKVLCEGLLDPHCQLQKLHLDYCELSVRNAEALSSALRTKTLTELNLSNNKLGDAAVKQLCEGLLDAHCQLESLQLESCRITAASCGDLGTVLSTKPSLKELCIGENKIGNAGAALLCQGVLNPDCKIEKLWLWECDFSAASCKDLSNVISTKESLKEISLIGNDLKDEGMEHLCQGLKSPKAAVQSLWLRECGLTAACCKSIASVLSQNGRLKELQIGSNNLQDEGVAQICEGLMDPNCTLQALWLGNSELTPACCDKLAAVIAAKQSLTELEVSNNSLEDEGVRKLCEAVRNPNCHLQHLILYDIFWSSEIEDELAALEESKPGFKAIY
uniref:ribonuclease inhibitor n=1 Tax=Euleptes europaea TaxID=460621 RepID=UPI002542170F|nr:ribonuclease inhibitor [Euleptes europaea]